MKRIFTTAVALMASPALVLVLSFPMATARADQSAQYLPNCLGVPIKAPSHIVFACGDGGIYATGVSWRQWGGYYAYGSGRLFINDCDPDCASGHFQPYELTLIAYGKQTCPNGEIAYRGVKMAYSRIYKVTPYVIGGRTYTTRYGALQQREQGFFCKPMM